MKAARNSSIELLRILAICGVIVLHYNGDHCTALDTVTEGSVNHWLLLGLEGLFICAVNLFVLITGFFSCTTQRRDPIKPIGLLLQVVLFNVAFYLLNALLDRSFSLNRLLFSLLPTNYFVVLYAVLFIISPYINLCLQHLNKAQRNKMVLVLFLLFALWPTLSDIAVEIRGRDIVGLNPVGAFGDSRGYTIVQFALMYILGAWLRLTDFRVKKRWCGLAVLGCTFLLAIAGKSHSGIAWSYCNPIVVVEAVAVFLLFSQLSFQSKWVNALSASTFTCFLIHGYILKYWKSASIVTGTPFILLMHILSACVIIYLLSWVIHQIYNFVMKPLLKVIKRALDGMKLDFSLNCEDK